MKDQNKNQVTSPKSQQDIMLIADSLQNLDQVATSMFKNDDMGKKNAPAGLLKKSNPRLFIL